MKKKMLLAALTTAMLLAGCGSGQPQSTTAAPDTQAAEETQGTVPADETQAAESQNTAELEDFDIVLDWYPNAVHSFIYEAIEKGYYAEEGLNVNIQFPSNTNDAMSLTAAGRADLGIYYMHDVIRARANENIPIKSVGTVCQDELNIILSLKDKNINSPSDLVGKKVGESGSEVSEAMIKLMMENSGVDAGDVEVINVGFDLLSSMTTGNVDATIGCMVNHEVPQLENEGFEVNYFYPSEYGIPNYYELIFVTSDQQIAEEGDRIARFLRASAKGFEDMKNDPAEALDILLNNQNEENFPLTRSVEEQSMEILLPTMDKDGSPFLTQAAEVWQANIDWMTENGLIQNTISPEDVMAEIAY